MKTLPIPKSLIRNVMGRLHVAATDEEAEKYFRSRLAADCPADHADRMAKFALRAHQENRQLAANVVSGLHKRAAARRAS